MEEQTFKYEEYSLTYYMDGMERYVFVFDNDEAVAIYNYKEKFYEALISEDTFNRIPKTYKTYHESFGCIIKPLTIDEVNDLLDKINALSEK